MGDPEWWALKRPDHFRRCECGAPVPGGLPCHCLRAAILQVV